MKHLYVIGNGFDIFTGLRTRYSDFQKWLGRNYAFIYEAMTMAYNIKGDWWCDFEVQLGQLDIKKYVEKFRPPEVSWDQIQEEIEERKAFEEKYHVPPSLHFESECAYRLEGLLDVLQYCFEKWVEDAQKTVVDPKYLTIEQEDSYFISFNYTDVLEWLYRIPEGRVLHIHGRAAKREHLVFGHNKMMLSRMHMGADKEKVGEILDRYNKNPYEYIFKHDLPEIIKDVEHVHVFGLSLSPVDEEYIDWIYNNTPNKCKWEVSWFSEEDSRRIDAFVLDHWGVKDRLHRISLEDIKTEQNFIDNVGVIVPLRSS